MTDFYKFLIISGCGWLLDIAVTMTLVQFDFAPFVASITGACVAVTFVYIVSLFTVFQMDVLSGLSGYGAYVVWQIFAISVASAAVSAIAYILDPALRSFMTHNGQEEVVDALALASGCAKILVTPATLVANFIFMKWLTQRHRAPHDQRDDRV